MRGGLLGVLFVAVALTSCSQEPPAYVSRYTEPPPAPAAAALPESSFFDSFDRPAMGPDWDMRGPYNGSFPLPPATDGFVKDGHYTYAGSAVVYAVRQFRSPVQRMGTVGEFHRNGDGAETGLAMAITPNSKLVADMVHFAVNRSVWNLTIRRNDGAFEPVANGTFTPTLALDREYQFEINATDTAVTVRVPGADQSYPADTRGLVGEKAFWEEYPTSTPAGTVFNFDAVWAAEAGEPLTATTR